MHQMIEDNTSSYLDLNRFLDPSITITPSLKYPHHASAKQNKIWNEDDRFKFENQVLMFVKDITAQITDLSKLLDSSELEINHDYIQHQKNILKCLRLEVTSLSDKIKHLIKARSQALHSMHIDHESDLLKQKQEKKLDQFVDDIMDDIMIENQIEIQQENKSNLDKFKEMLKLKNLKNMGMGMTTTMTIKNKDDAQDLNVIDEEDEKYGVGMGHNLRMDDGQNMELSQWEIQEFKRENEEMVKYFDQQYEEVVKAEQSTTEIVELIGLLTEELLRQDGTVMSIDQAILKSLENLELGNKELQKAQERGKQNRTVFITVVLTLAFSLVFLDWYKS